MEGDSSVLLHNILWNVNVLKATIENKATFVTTHFKKLITGNNVFIVSVIIESNCHILQCFSSNVQCVRLFAGRLTHKMCCYIVEVALFSVVAFKTLTFHKVV